MLRLLALPVLLALPAAAPDAGKLRAGDTLPPLRGEYLSGREAALPEDARGRVTLVLLGFSYASRIPVEAWGARFREAFAADSAVTFYEVPMMSGVSARLGKPFIDRGMRSGTPRDLHDNVFTVWSGVGEWRRRLAARDRALAYLVLLDREGRVAWTGAGDGDLEAFEALAGRVRELVAR